MKHKFILELTDDCKGYEQEIGHLERVYGIEPVKYHDKEIYNKAINDALEKLYSHYHDVTKEIRYPQHVYYCNGVSDCIDIAEQLKVGGE